MATPERPVIPPGVRLLHLIVACARNRVIGRDRRLPWSIPEDLAHFHRATAGQICVLGRICYETWPRARADGRRCVVISRRRELAQPGVQVASSLAAALAAAEALPGEIFVCGGERIFTETVALAGSRPLRLHLTLVDADVPGDTFFPEWRHLAWQEVDRRASADAHYRYTFLTLDLVAPPARP
jgi:dihydrofolate reductase